LPGAEAESRMIRVTIKLMAKRGYNGFSLADVAEAAGYSRGLSGHYFGPKDQMLADAAQFIVRSYHLAARVQGHQLGCSGQF
jgi:AcrR family transcriptional regulator